jgi:betaine-aldehyde dehydrogenase
MRKKIAMNRHATTLKPAEKAWPDVVMPTRRDLFYDGHWQESKSGRTIEIYSPGTQESLGHIADANVEDVDAAVRAAHRAFPAWRRLAPQERVAMVKQGAQVLRDRASELGMLDAVDSGNPVRSMTNDVLWMANMADYYAGLLTEVKGESFLTADGVVDFTLRQPYGVVGCIAAFNHPVMNTLGQVIPALLTGNTAVLKPSQYTSLASLRIAELYASIFPKGVFNVVTGAVECGQALSSHPLTSLITLIGSAPTARAVMRSMADRIKPGVMELGGKNAMVVCPDADPLKVAAGATLGMNFTSTSGQSCMSNSRVFLHKDIYDAALPEIVKRVSELKCGDPRDPATQVGAMTSREQYRKVLDYIELGKQAGARVACGGGPPADDGLAKGLFIEPTVLVDVTQNMRVAQEEIFGPVMSVLRWEDEATMLEQVNSVELGLTGSVWTRDLATAHRVAGEMQAGYIWVNNSAIPLFGAPIGGYKQSGIGRVMCFEQLMEMTQVKNVHIKLEA